tara:strand:+ start:247 stop:474 length:228 start_codon:yes stop_codon:yes gene_type:complete
MKNLNRQLNRRAMMLIEVYEHYADRNINKEKVDLLTDNQLEKLYLEILTEKQEEAEQLAIQHDKDIKNGLYGEEY